MSTSFWDCFDLIPGCSASAGTWRKHLGENFEFVRNRFLMPDLHTSQEAVEPNGHNGESDTKERILQLDWSKLGSALCDAFDLNRRVMELPLPGTRQIGSWSMDAVPVVLTIQTDRIMFRYVICELAVRLRAPYILLGPTSSHMDAGCHELLSNSHAGFFPLSSYVLLTERGVLRVRGCVGELFRAFTPRSDEMHDEDSIRTAFALVKALDHKRRFKHPSPTTVFSFYCIEGLSISAIARECQCSRGTIMNRLKFIHKHTGVDPDTMRRMSGTFEGASDQLSDHRARYVSRKQLVDDSEEAGY
jgi:hypothetical protein